MAEKGSMIAIVKGTNADDIVKVLLQLPEDKRNAVKEVTMDFSDSMYSIVQAAFPNATIVIDCFHIIQRCTDSIEELRLKIKRKELAKRRREEEAIHERKQRKRASAVQNTEPVIQRTTMARSVGASLCGSMPKYVPERLSNSDTVLDLLTRGKGFLPGQATSGHETRKQGSSPAVQALPRFTEGLWLFQSLRSIFGTGKKKKDMRLPEKRHRSNLMNGARRLQTASLGK